MSGAIHGTPAYMASEQARPSRGDGPDEITDVYGLGATLYYCLAGRDPFRGSSVFEIVDSVLLRDPTPARLIEPGTPEALEVVCMKAMAKERERRYPGMKELAEDLKRYLEGGPILAKRPSIAYGIGRRLRRHPVRYALGAALLVVLSAASVLLWSTGRRHEDALEAERLRRTETAWGVLGPLTEQIEHLEHLVYGRGLSGEDVDGLAVPLLRETEVLIEDQPGFGPAIAWHGRALTLMGRLEEAEEYFDEACRNSEESAEAWFLRGIHYMWMYIVSRRLPAMTTGAAGLQIGASRPRATSRREACQMKNKALDCRKTTRRVR